MVVCSVCSACVYVCMHVCMHVSHYHLFCDGLGLEWLGLVGWLSVGWVVQRFRITCVILNSPLTMLGVWVSCVGEGVPVASYYYLFCVGLGFVWLRLECCLWGGWANGCG